MRVSSEAQAEAGSFAPTTQPAAIPWLLRRVMRQLECGRLTVILPSGRRISHVGVQPGPHGIMQVHDNRAFRRLLTRGDVGFSEGYVAGDWSSPDLTALIAMAAENIARLDRSMTYSSACWIAPGQSLEAAQQDKLDRIAKLLSLRGDDEVLEIGCGWGALAVHLAQRCGRVAGLTLSTEQLAYARRRAVYAGMSDRIDFRLQDYREEVGRYDRIVSIEMLEAVGEAYWPAYFERLRACLKPGGRIVLQAITIREDRFDAYKRTPDFIQRHIFPGGMLPTTAILSNQAARAGLAITHSETFGRGYADTLAEWRRRFDAAWPQILRQGFDPDFRRLWDYYLSYCEAGFRTGTIDVGLYVLEEAA